MAWRLITVKQCNTSPSLGCDPSEKHGTTPSYEPTPTAQSWEDQPAFYFLTEILALGDRTPEVLREIHQTKLAYPGLRVVQERVETSPESRLEILGDAKG